MTRTLSAIPEPSAPGDLIGVLQAALSGWATGPVAALEALISRWEVRA